MEHGQNFFVSSRASLRLKRGKQKKKKKKKVRKETSVRQSMIQYISQFNTSNAYNSSYRGFNRPWTLIAFRSVPAPSSGGGYFQRHDENRYVVWIRDNAAGKAIYWAWFDERA